jgi:pilus assembly protein Flp/PilA
MRKFIAVTKSFMTDESGATMVEYALMVALIAVVAAVTATTLGTSIAAQFTSVGTSI